jgi:hypothetical protein
MNGNLERLLDVISYGASGTLSLMRKTLNLPIRTHHCHSSDFCRHHHHSSNLCHCHHHSSNLCQCYHHSRNMCHRHHYNSDLCCRHHHHSQLRRCPRRQLCISRRHYNQRNLYCCKRRQLHHNLRELRCRKKRQCHHLLRGFNLFYHMRRLMQN